MILLMRSSGVSVPRRVQVARGACPTGGQPSRSHGRAHQGEGSLENFNNWQGPVGYALLRAPLAQAQAVARSYSISLP